MTRATRRGAQRLVEVASGAARLAAYVELPAEPRAVVVLADASGPGRRPPRNGALAAALRGRALGTLLVELLTPEEDVAVAPRFDIGLLTTRLAAAVRWVEAEPATAGLPIGLLGAGTAAAAALQVAAALRAEIGAVVARDGRPDLASRKALALVKAPTLLVVGAGDHDALQLNERTLEALGCEKALAALAAAARPAAEAKAIAEAASLAAGWFVRHLARRAPA